MRRFWTLSALVACLATMSWPQRIHGQASRAYLVEDIGTLGVANIEGLAINENGDIAGYAQLPSGEYHAFRYTTGAGVEDLGGAAFGFFSQALAINAAGDVVGTFLDHNGMEHGFLAPAEGGMQDLLSDERPIGAVTSITDDGRMAGWMYTPAGENHAFRTMVGGALQDLGTSGFKSTAWRMNAVGQVTGTEAPVTFPSEGRFTAFRFSDAAGKVDLGTFGGRTSFGLAINGSNVIVGCASLDDVRSHAFRALEGSPLEDLGTLGGTSSCAEGINDAGEIVGWSDLANGQGHAFVYTDSEGMIDLNGAVPAALGLRLVFARAINGRGQIVAISNTLDGIRTYRLTPVEPDRTPPVIAAASVTPATIWPPDGRMVPATVTVDATDNDSTPRCRIIAVSVLEGGAVVPGAAGDAQITGDLTLAVRARRSGGASRFYNAAVSCSDASNNTAAATVTITVSHSAGS